MLNDKYISHEKALEIINSQEKHIILDVRSHKEYINKHIKNAINLPIENIEEEIEHLADKKDLILIYCKSGMRSSIASTTLTNLGYENAISIGGIEKWPGETVQES